MRSRSDSTRTVYASPELISSRWTLPARAEHVVDRRQHAFFGHHRMHLGLEPRAQLHELGAVADQLAELPDRRRRDPRLRQATQPQHVRQVAGVDVRRS